MPIKNIILFHSGALSDVEKPGLKSLFVFHQVSREVLIVLIILFISIMGFFFYIVLSLNRIVLMSSYFIKLYLIALQCKNRKIIKHLHVEYT